MPKLTIVDPEKELESTRVLTPAGDSMMCDMYIYYPPVAEIARNSLLSNPYKVRRAE